MAGFLHKLFCVSLFAESRSNSMGHVYLHSPSDVFGSLISDTEEFLEDFQMNHRGSIGTNVYTPISQSPITPPISPPPQFRIIAALPLAGASITNIDRDENETDQNALVEFNRKKAQHEMFQ